MAIRKPELDRRMEHFEQVCRRQGLRVTHQRTEIFRGLAATDEHPDAETIYRRVHARIPAVSLDTVYRTLALLEREGLVRRAEARSGPARWDANAERHHHFVCTTCGLIRDVPAEELGGAAVPAAVRRLGRVAAQDVFWRGVCTRCVDAQPGRR